MPRKWVIEVRLNSVACFGVLLCDILLSLDLAMIVF